MAVLIEPRVLKGFRDSLPAAEIARRGLAGRVEAVFRSYGFAPIDTPALEYAEILLGKAGGETEKQVYRFRDNGGRDIALRFDLTVPFARFTAEHRADLPLPFKRYHIAKVWRGENTQRGRYREFTQCDFDTIGSDSAAADFEILLIMKDALEAAGAGRFKIRLNHRGLFNRFLLTLGVQDKAGAILRAVDKLAKIGKDGVVSLLAAECGDGKAEAIAAYAEPKGGWDGTLSAMTEAAGGPDTDTERLETLRRFMLDTGTADCFVLDPSITRGLDYYTGIVFETFLDDLPSIGSVCSGGRYGNLSGLYSREPVSGVGSSIGLDRLLAALEARDEAPTRATYALAAVICVNAAHGGVYQAIARKLRDAGLACEVFLDAGKPTAQFALAEKKGIRWALIPDADSPADAPLMLRDLKARTNSEPLTVDGAIAALKSLSAEDPPR